MIIENETKNRIKALFKDAGYTMQQVCQLLTNSHSDRPVTPQNLSNKLTKDTLRFSEALEIADVCGYDLMFVKRGTQINATPATETKDDEYLQSLLTDEKPLYVFCETAEDATTFLKQLEDEGYLFGDGKKPSEKEPDNLYRILPNKRICYVGGIGRIRYQTDDNAIRITMTSKALPFDDHIAG